MNIFKRLRAALMYGEAVRKADKAHSLDGKRYYVLPNGDSGKLIIMDRKNFRILKDKHYIHVGANIGRLEQDCFYCTPYANGKGQLSEESIGIRRRNFLAYVDNCHDAAKARRKARRLKR